ncbi:MAG TPA: hypothetical protein VN653_05855 [Anaerolineales bacterium]|nr:hypothetical protein [Anaerolineales bacterium]
MSLLFSVNIIERQSQEHFMIPAVLVSVSPLSRRMIAKIALNAHRLSASSTASTAASTDNLLNAALS